MCKKINKTPDNEQSNRKAQLSPARSSCSKYKSNKKSEKSEKNLNKTPLKPEETYELPQTSAKKENIYRKSSKTTNKTSAPTKVKSASWKRSEKAVSPFNVLTNKKHKNLRKKSPNWLRFSNTKVKITDSKQLANDIEPTSACRPGTLYSDVLFGAGHTNLVKIKNLTPRSANNNNNTTCSTAQKKLCKALFKFKNQSGKESSDESEIEDNKNELFPVLQKVDNKIFSSGLKTEEIILSDDIKPLNSQVNVAIEDLKRDDNQATTTTSNNKIKEEVNSVSETLENSFDQHFHNFKDNLSQECATYEKDQTLLLTPYLEISNWNFTVADTAADAFPKFLGQFDDENYLKAEKIAWLGLKLALGNNSMETNSKS
ncbi:uncharacterized protein ACRADG_011783 isoform 2-T2 [Cochliomyia hominivorax]